MTAEPPSSRPGSKAPKRRRTPLLGAAGPYLLLGWQIALGFVAYVGIGYGLDVWLGTTPWFLLLGLLLGVVSIFARIYRLVIELDQNAPRKQSAGEEDAGSQP